MRYKNSMKRLYLLTFLLIFLPSYSFAQSIAIVDTDYIMNQSDAAKSIKSQLKTQREKFQQDFQSAEKALQEQEKSIIEKRPNLTDDEFKKQIDAFRQKMVSEERKFKQKQENVSQALNSALAELEKEIGLAIQQISKEKGFKFVLSKQDVLFAAAGQPDITQETLSLLNAKKKTIQVKTLN